MQAYFGEEVHFDKAKQVPSCASSILDSILPEAWGKTKRCPSNGSEAIKERSKTWW